MSRVLFLQKYPKNKRFQTISRQSFHCRAYSGDTRLLFIYVAVVAIASVTFQPYRIDNEYLTQGNFVAIPVESIDKVFVKESGSVVVYYTKPYKDEEYSNTVYPVDTKGFVEALQQLNEEMTILRENS